MAFYGFLWLFMAFTQKYGFLWNSHQTDDFGVPGIAEKLSFRKKILFVAEAPKPRASASNGAHTPHVCAQRAFEFEPPSEVPFPANPDSEKLQTPNDPPMTLPSFYYETSRLRLG
jgi:hypothetical protein